MRSKLDLAFPRKSFAHSQQSFTLCEMVKIEYSPNSASTCQSCHHKILYGQIRVCVKAASEFGGRYGRYGGSGITFINKYHHANCYSNRRDFTKFYGFYKLIEEGVTKVAGGGVVFEVGARLVGINADEEEMLYGLGIWVVEFDEEGLGSSLLYPRVIESRPQCDGKNLPECRPHPSVRASP